MGFDPVTIGLAISAIGAATGVYSAIEQKQQQSRAAKIASKRRAAELDQAERNIAAKRREKRKRMARLRAKYGRSGLYLEGSPYTVIAESERNLSEEIEFMETRKADLAFQGDLLSMEAKRASRAASTNIFSEGVTLGSDLLSLGSRMAKPKPAPVASPYRQAINQAIT